MKKILIFIIVLVAMSLISGIAGSQVKGTISGRVTDESGNGIPHVYVSVNDYIFSYWINGSYTDSNGNYSIKVPAGTYNVQFKQLPSDGYYAPEWYNNKSNSPVADLVTVTANQTTSNINAQLEIGGTISGRVTDVSGNGIVSVSVYAYDLNKNVINSTRTNSKGDYTIPLAAGDYKVRFYPHPGLGNYASEWYNNKSDFESADTVTVKKRYTNKNINAQLEPM